MKIATHFTLLLVKQATLATILAAILAAVLTGCAFDRRRLQASGDPIQTQAVQTRPGESLPSSPVPALEAGTRLPSTTPTLAASSAEGAQGQKLLDLIDQLSAANQASDPFDDFP